MKVAAIAAISPNSQARSARSQEQACVNCQKITSNKEEEEKTMLGTEKKEKTEKVPSSQFSNFWFKVSGRLEHTLSLPFFERPVSLVINFFLFQVIGSRFLLLVTKR